MNASELKYRHESNHPDSYFFTRKTMSFFGDTMKNFGVYSAGPYWVLYRKAPTSKGAPSNQWLFSRADFKLMPRGGKSLAEIIAEHVNN